MKIFTGITYTGISRQRHETLQQTQTHQTGAIIGWRRASEGLAGLPDESSVSEPDSRLDWYDGVSCGARRHLKTGNPLSCE
jgi:hypothetical protein